MTTTEPRTQELPHGDVTVERIELSAELAGGEGRATSADVAEYALWLGDDALILSQQLGAWIARARRGRRLGEEPGKCTADPSCALVNAR